MPPRRFVSVAFNVTVVVLLIIATLPVFVFISLLIWWSDGGPVIYKGTRLGISKKPFTMYKFRTLVSDADRAIGADLLGNKRHLITPIGQFLRNTRLDELPQLFNVLKGDMELVGPRPVRPEVYRHMCKQIPGYDKRFVVKPGLVGVSQLFTPHSTPKAIRSFIDNMLLLKSKGVVWATYVLVLSGILMLATIARQGARRVYKHLIAEKLLGRFTEKRKFERVKPRPSRAYIRAESNHKMFELVGEIVDVNPEAFLVRCKYPIGGPFPRLLRLEAECRRRSGGRKKIKRALCECELYRQVQVGPSAYECVFTYTPASPLNFYMIHQYFLRESVVRRS